MCKTFAISDIHGCYNLFCKLLKIIDWEAEKKKGSKLVLLGDYVDKGSEPIKTLKYIKQLKHESPEQVTALLGNHDFFWLEQAEYYKNMSSFPHFLKKYFDNSHIAVECLKGSGIYTVDIIAGKRIYYVHAGFDLKKSLLQQDVQFMLWAREEFFFANDEIHTDFKDSIIVFGHTPTVTLYDVYSQDYKLEFLENSRVLIIDGFKIDIDTGAAYRGELSALEISDIEDKLNFKVYSTNQFNTLQF